ncbi:capsid decoration protein [Gordonia phage Pytheas]|nr:capsid decoration protein [Gordonia Phage Jablanski]UYL88034.1 capsid decoration protein [Gordonia phage Pytheas]
MDLTLRTETIGAGDQSWLGSAHGTDACRTVTINRSALTKATHFPDGRLKSGFALALVSGKYVPYNSAGSGGTEVLAGFLFTDQAVRDGGGDIVAPLFDHGRVKLAKLPSTSPTVTASATTSGQFIFV